MVGAARAHGKPERHRLQRPRLVTRDLESLDLRSNRDAAVTDRASRAAAALGQQIAKAVTRPDQIDRPQQRVATPKVSHGPASQPRPTHPMANPKVPTVLMV